MLPASGSSARSSINRCENRLRPLDGREGCEQNLVAGQRKKQVAGGTGQVGKEGEGHGGGQGQDHSGLEWRVGRVPKEGWAIRWSQGGGGLYLEGEGRPWELRRRKGP